MPPRSVAKRGQSQGHGAQSQARRRCVESAPDAALESLAARLVLDALGDVRVWAKDRRGRFVYCNRSFLALVGARSAADVIGRVDADFFPPDLCESYARDDRAVLEAGRPLVDQIELIRNPDGAIGWYSTTKLAIPDARGRPAAVVGFTRDLREQGSATARFLSMAPAVEAIMSGYGGPLSVPALAAFTGLSVSQFERTWKRRFGATPTATITQVRIKAASELLTTTDLRVAEIAQRTGFCDQSHFTHQFRRAKGVPPTTYRRRHARRGRE